MRNKIYTIKELSPIVYELKKKGETVVLTNGCFDFIHVGHIRYLKEAKDLGDILIVGINSDSSVRALKGKNRPIIRAEERAEILAAIEYVDFVTIFYEDRATRLLKELKPHVHAKGTDYSEATVPERDTVLSYGGKVAICGDKKERSSTGYIKKSMPPA